MSASAEELEQACMVQEQPTRTSASKRRIKRLQKLVGKSVAPVSSYLWQNHARRTSASGMRDGRVSQRAAIKFVSRGPGSQSFDSLGRTSRSEASASDARVLLMRETGCVMQRALEIRMS
jgi:hypothetical protein